MPGHEAEGFPVVDPDDPGARLPSARLPERMAERMADTMFALSTPNRLQILVALRAGPQTVSEIVDAVGMEQSAVSHQLRVLRERSVVTMRRIGRTRQYALRDKHVAALIDIALEHVRALERPGSDGAGEPASAGNHRGRAATSAAS